jgi:hypothetical protein
MLFVIVGAVDSQLLAGIGRAVALPPGNRDASIATGARSTDDRSVVAAFTRRSYRPGETAVLDFWHDYRDVRIELLHVGPEQQLTIGNDTLEGVPVGPRIRVARARGAVRIHVGEWESGVYAARLASGAKVGFAPFIVRPSRFGAQPVAVVQPTNTWQAYNFRDADGDGEPDTWYYWAGHTRTIDLRRPYLNHGVPPHFRSYDLTFLRWLAHTGRDVDMLAEEDIERLGERLRNLYRLIVFPGHHEYVTGPEYDAVQQYRDLGGNLAFLAADNFFWRVDRHGNHLTRIDLWRNLGRPEAALVGVQYFAWNQGRFDRRPYVVTGANLAPWLFAGTGLHNGKEFAMFGIETDRPAPASPPSLRVLATIPRIFNTRRSATMTYYESPAGGRVFAAGAFTLSNTYLRCASVATLLANLWNNLAGERSPDRYPQADLGPCPA